MNHILFFGKMKLADVLLTNYKLLLVLNRFDIHLGFGEKSVEEVCSLRGIPPSLFLIVCNVYTFEDYLPAENELQSLDMNSLLQYLQNSHRYYKGICWPGIRVKLDTIAEQSNSRPAQILQRFYSEYQKEVLNHFDYEETVAFPYINTLLNNSSMKSYSISQFEKNHSNIEEKLNDLKNIIIKYLPDTGSPELLNTLLFDLFELEDDFRKHTLIEDKILVPLVEQFEQKR